MKVFPMVATATMFILLAYAKADASVVLYVLVLQLWFITSVPNPTASDIFWAIPASPIEPFKSEIL